MSEGLYSTAATASNPKMEKATYTDEYYTFCSTI